MSWIPPPNPEVPQNRSDAGSQDSRMARSSNVEYSEVVAEVLQRTEVTTDGLRILYDEMLTHVDRTYVQIGEQALDELFDRCRTDFQRLAEGRLGELADSIERLRRTVYGLEHRITLLERAPANNRGRRGHAEEDTFLPPTHPNSFDMGVNPLINPLHVPPFPRPTPVRVMPEF